MAHTQKDKKTLLTRVRRIKGQADSLERAIAEDAECSAILQQIAAIRGAVTGLMNQVLDGHIREHIGSADDPVQRQYEIDELLVILKSYLK